MSLIIIDCVTKIWLLHASVTEYVLVIVSGHDNPSDESETHATTGVIGQLSAASVTTLISWAGTSPIHCTGIAARLLAVGFIVSSTLIICTAVAVFPHTSVIVNVLVTIKGQLEFGVITSI